MFWKNKNCRQHFLTICKVPRLVLGRNTKIFRGISGYLMVLIGMNKLNKKIWNMNSIKTFTYSSRSSGAVYVFYCSLDKVYLITLWYQLIREKPLKFWNIMIIWKRIEARVSVFIMSMRICINNKNIPLTVCTKTHTLHGHSVCVSMRMCTWTLMGNS